jgi:hypothetical protein
MIMGVLLFVAAPTSAFILAVHAACAGHRSGEIAVIVSGLLLLATIVVTLLYGGWIGLAAVAVAAVLVLAGVLSRRIARMVSGLLLATFVFFLLWAGLAVIAMIQVLVFAWAQSRNKPPPGPDGTQRERDRLWIPHRQLPLNGLREFTSLAPSSLTRHVPPARPGISARPRSTPTA